MENWGRFRDSQYYISDLGRIKNKHGRILKVSVNKKGYTKIVLRLDKQKVNFSLYRIVAEVFIGDVKGKIVDHIDRDRGNNKLTNLRIVDAKTNSQNKLMMNRNVTLDYIHEIVYLTNLGLTVNEIDIKINGW
jgi:hypothetical protein